MEQQTVWQREYGRLRSILLTARQRGVETLEYWRRVLTGPERQPRLLQPEPTAA